MKFRQLRAASVELHHAIVWYRDRSPRAAENFWLRVMEARRSIAMFPLAAPLTSPHCRRFILSGYPYDLIYSLRKDEIVIVAFAHHSRRPGYWQSRLAES